MRSERPPSDLEGRAAEGRQRRVEHEAVMEQSAPADRELLIALGDHYGTKQQRLVGKLLKAALVLFAAGLLLAGLSPGDAPRVLGLVGFIATMVLLPLRFGITPTASAAQREAEEVWLRGGDGASWSSSAISGQTNLRQNKQPIYRNHRLVRHVHELVEQVLLPLHREYPLKRASISRE